MFRQTHNSFIKDIIYYEGADKVDECYYSLGAILGVITTGILCDLVLKKKNFLTICILNIVLFMWDIFLFAQAGKPEGSKTEHIVFSCFLGLILASADLIYLILIPMEIAK